MEREQLKKAADQSWGFGINDQPKPTVERMSLRIGNMQVRTCDNSLCGGRPHETAEIVVWQDTTSGIETCFSVAWWNKGKEGYDLRFCGDRPFRHCDPLTFWRLAEFGDQHLAKCFRESKGES